MLADPMLVAGAQSTGDLEPAADEDGEPGRVRAQRLTRRLVEDPAVYLEDLDERDRQYFLTQRGPLERRAADISGLQVERRREGSALIAAGRELSDRPFPGRSHRKQLALLLLTELCSLDQSRRAARPGGESGAPVSVAEDRVLEIVGMLVARHREHWGFSPEDQVEVQAARGGGDPAAGGADAAALRSGRHAAAPRGVPLPARRRQGRAAELVRRCRSSGGRPMTATDRFRPNRYGIVSLYQYAEQVFSPEDGRLALRGRNTSGKSKALELLVPFVLDGDITPRKLDAFASPTRAKTMRWNLIECTDDYGRDAKRIGYVLAGFVRPRDDGDGQVLTCGIGLEAARGSDGIKDRWYFVTPQRIGIDLHLCRDVRDERQPLVKGDLADAVRAGGGQLFDSQADYKEALRSALLPFPSRELYEQHLEVIRQLRKPKLSDKLDIDGLGALLSRTLPVVDDALMRRLGDSLERLQGMQGEADALAQACELVAELAGGPFRAYARGVVATRAEALRQSESSFERARIAERSARAALAECETARREAEGQIQLLDAERKQRQAEREALMASEDYKGLAALEERRREREEAAARLREREQEHAKRAARLEQAQQQHDEAATRSRDELDALESVATRLRDGATAAGLALAGADRLATGTDQLAVGADQAGLERIEAALEMRRAELEQARVLHRELHRARDAADALREPLEQAQTEVEHAQAQHERAQEALEGARERVEQALDAWAEQLVELELSDADVESLRELLIDGRDGGARAGEFGRPRLQALLGQQASLRARRDEFGTRLANVAERLRALLSEGDPAPAPRSPRRADRAGRAGAPLWLVCDFAAELPAQERGPLEAALEEAGLLDAWISPDGKPYEGDSVLLPEPVDCPSLAQLLRPAVGQTGIDPDRVAAVLASVALEGPLSVQPGSFRLGPLHGRHAKSVPEFIGAAAREARRQAQIAAAQTEQAELEGELAVLAGEADQLEAAQARLRAEQDSVPPASDVQATIRTLVSRADQLANAELARAGLLSRRDSAEDVVAAARAAVAGHAGGAGLPAEEAQLEPLERALRTVATDLGEARIQLAGCEHARTQLAAAEATHAERAADADESARREQAAGHQLGEAQGRLAATERLHGAKAQEIQERSDQLRRRLAAIDSERSAADAGHLGASIGEANATRDVDDAIEAVERADGARAGALQAVRQLGAHDLFSAGLGEEHAPAGERQSGSWTLTTALERVRALPELDQRVDLANRRRRVEESVSELAKRLVAFDMDAALRSDGELMLIQMSWHGAVRTLTQMVRELREDLIRREQIMSEERRKGFGDALLSEIAEHLRVRVGEVRASVRKRNETLRRCKTGAGRWVQLRWQKALEPEAERDVLALLEGQSVELLGEAERRQLFAFFEARIVLARGELLENPHRPASAADYLAQAFDYRSWWSFDLIAPRTESGAAPADPGGAGQGVGRRAVGADAHAAAAP